MVTCNDEQLLDFALHYLSTAPDPYNTHPVAEEIVISYIVEYFIKNDIEFTDEDVKAEYAEMLTSYIIKNLVNKGLVTEYINENGDIEYKVEDINGCEGN